MGPAPKFEGIPSVPVLIAGLFSDTTLRISHIPVLTASDNRRSCDRVIGVSKVQSLVTAPKSDISVCASNKGWTFTIVPRHPFEGRSESEPKYPAMVRLETRNRLKAERFWSFGNPIRSVLCPLRNVPPTHLWISRASATENWLKRDIRVQIGRSTNS